MKLVFINLYGKNVRRGAESFSHKLGEKLRKNHTVCFIEGESTTMPISSFSTSFLKNILKRMFLDKPGREVLSFTVRQALPEIYRLRPDVVFPLNGFWQVFFLKLFQPFLQYKIIITGHSGPGWDERWNLYLKPDVFVGTTPQTETWARNTSWWTRVAMIPLAVDIDMYMHAQPSQLDFEKPMYLCVAALVPYKRIDLVIKAFGKIKNGSLIIVGDGPEKQHLLALGSELGARRFSILSVPYDQIPAIYQQADVFTLASSAQESFGMVYLEAMAAGKPIVTTDTPRTRWILQDMGLFVNPEDTLVYADTLAVAAQRAITQTARTALDRFTWETVRSQYDQLIRDICTY